ncbi:hypothetical protein ACOZ4N_00540 (plasmid) [Halorientalis pallida]|uniref:hypothetical protein n=1 Tax=Halorientalis pallida TaxID=2479928 RepID=UPI003C7017FA
MSLGKKALLVVLAVALLSATFVQPVAAQSSCDPSNTDNCDAGKDGLSSMLSNVHSLAMMVLKYVGFIAIVAGAVLWWSARKSSSRAQYGMWLFGGGAGMIVFYFGFGIFISVLKFITNVGGP